MHLFHKSRNICHIYYFVCLYSCVLFITGDGSAESIGERKLVLRYQRLFPDEPADCGILRSPLMREILGGAVGELGLPSRGRGAPESRGNLPQVWFSRCDGLCRLHPLKVGGYTLLGSLTRVTKSYPSRNEPSTRAKRGTRQSWSKLLVTTPAA